MPKYRTISLTDEEEADLIEIRDHAEKPYLRERASAILQVSRGVLGAG